MVSSLHFEAQTLNLLGRGTNAGRDRDWQYDGAHTVVAYLRPDHLEVRRLTPREAAPFRAFIFILCVGRIVNDSASDDGDGGLVARQGGECLWVCECGGNRWSSP